MKLQNWHSSIGLAAAALGAFALVGCDEGPGSPSSTSTPHTTPSNQPSPPITADNTGKNTRDRDGSTVTPLDQGESDGERRITSEIRSAILARSGMSMNAQNCKIVTKDGVVTLRGPVASQAEKDAIGSIAKAVPGVTSVVNELEIAP